MAQLFFLPIGTINGIEYCKMLEDKLEIHMAIHECNMFMQDSAPCHCSKLVSNFLKKKNIKTSPHLNPIKNFWVAIKDKVADEHPTSAKDLKMAIKCIWPQTITAEYCKHLVHSMPCRLQAAIQNKGGHTKY